MDKHWGSGRKLPNAGWPRQVRCADILKDKCAGLEIADFIAWTANRHLRYADEPLLGIISVSCIRHSSVVYDFSTIMHSYDTAGNVVTQFEPGFQPTTLRVQLKVR